MDPVLNDSQFQQDDADLLSTAQQVQDALKNQADDEASYKRKQEKISSNPEVAFLQLISLIYGSSDDSTMGGLVEDNIKNTGLRLKLNADMTAVGNDLNNMVNSSNDNPGSLRVFANDASQFMGQISGDKANPFYNQNLDPHLANPSLDPEAQGSVYNEVQSIRQMFNISNAAVPGDNPGSGEKSYFSDTDSTKIQSFKEYADLLSEKGDNKNATEAAKYITDDFATNTQTTQTASAVLNNDMKTFSALLQSIQQFDASMIQLVNTIKKSSLSHQVTS